MLKTLTGTLVYTTLQTPTKCFEATKGEEWKVSVVVDEDTADAFGEIYPKQAAKAVKTADFEEIYKIPAPIPEAKKQFIITLRKNTKLANGEDVPEKYRPRALLLTEDGKEDITMTTLVGNGSKGKVSIDHYAGKMGDVARLQNVLVTDLVEYIAAAKDELGSEFDDDTPAKPVSKPAAKPAAKSAAKKADKSEDDDSPF